MITEDRFNFNAVVTGYYAKETEDVCDDIEVDIYLENVDVQAGGDSIGVYVDDLLDAVKKQHPGLLDEEIEDLRQYFEDNSSSYDNEQWFCITPTKIFQCTGFKDSDGILIYEGDQVLLSTEGIGDIKYSEGGYIICNRKSLQCLKLTKNRARELRVAGHFKS